MIVINRKPIPVFKDYVNFTLDLKFAFIQFDPSMPYEIPWIYSSISFCKISKIKIIYT